MIVKYKLSSIASSSKEELVGIVLRSVFLSKNERYFEILNSNSEIVLINNKKYEITFI